MGVSDGGSQSPMKKKKSRRGRYWKLCKFHIYSVCLQNPNQVEDKLYRICAMMYFGVGGGCRCDHNGVEYSKGV